MGVGPFFLWLALATCVLTLVLYVHAVKTGRAAVGAPRRGWYVHSGLVLGAVVTLWWIIFQRDYAYSYVVSYTSNDLNFWYRLSAFWAGQEGSFLLWAALSAIIGLLLIRQGGEYEPPTMIWIAAVQIGLLILMLMKSPFAPVPGHPPADGHGLNALLQNPWMVLHPPAVFLGYAAMALPFAFGVTGLLRHEYDEWVGRALPWCLFAWVTLGLGIILGGYWSYETLGWGGYWAWDPVENASLVPWILCTALLHGLLVQKTTRGLRSLNLFLAALVFTAVLYGTYLTRSGVLGDFSVHSFVRMGTGYNFCLISLIVFPVATWGVLFGLRKREITSEPAYETPRSLAFFLYLGIVVLLVSAGLVAVGMSSPLLTRLVSREPSAVKVSFYNLTHVPLGILLALLVTFAPVVPWRNADWRNVLKRLTGAGIAAVLAMVGTGVGTAAYLKATKASTDAAMAAGPHLVVWLLWAGCGAAALWTNGTALLAPRRAGGWRRKGAPTAHLGLALMLLSFVGSSVYDREQPLTLHKGQTKTVMGYRIRNEGAHRRRDHKLQIDVAVQAGGRVFNGSGLIFETDQGLMRTPIIRRGLFADLYLAPESIQGDEPVDRGLVTLSKGHSARVGPFTVTFVGFEMSSHDKSGAMSVGAKLIIEQDGKTETVVPRYVVAGESVKHPPTSFAAGTASVSFLSMVVESGTVELQFAGNKISGTGPGTRKPTETLRLHVSHKPMMTPLWLGCLLLLLGGCLATRRRAGEARRDRSAEERNSARRAAKRSQSERRRSGKRRRR